MIGLQRRAAGIVEAGADIIRRSVSAALFQDDIIENALASNIEAFCIAADQFDSLHPCGLNPRQVGGHVVGFT